MIEDPLFETIMNALMSIMFGIITFMFIPLFWIFMKRLKEAYEGFYDQIIRKVVLAFTIYELIMTFRYIWYLNLQWDAFKFFGPQGMHSEIPFFISELVIAVFYIYGLHRVY